MFPAPKYYSIYYPFIYTELDLRPSLGDRSIELVKPSQISLKELKTTKLF
jgi:hypothetical protein